MSQKEYFFNSSARYYTNKDSSQVCEDLNFCEAEIRVNTVSPSGRTYFQYFWFKELIPFIEYKVSINELFWVITKWKQITYGRYRKNI